ncbi:MAG TPA: AIPR family protein [Terriglobales bacterium]|nr:AIPR family protein [Terriglobales bacterium]
MPANDVLALEANFQGWKKNRFPAPQNGDQSFLYYCAENFARAFDLGDSQLKSGIVDGGGDGGVDAFYILANGELVDAETELDPKEPPDFKLIVMQVKGGDEGFSPAGVDKLFWFARDLLDLAKKKANYHSQYHSELVAMMRLFKDKLGIVVGETPAMAIEFLYVIRKDVTPNRDCEKSAGNLKAECLKHFPHIQANFRFVNAEALWKQVQARPPKKRTLRWAAQPLSTQEGEIGLVKLIDYFDFIKDPDGKLAERFFDSNVRGYWPDSQINKRIDETLGNLQSPEFWLLNNGITIIAERAESPQYLEVEVHDPQIVNGLQTSRVIYTHFSAAMPAPGDGRRVLVRVIKTGDKPTRDAVIRCTNSQNQMPEESLRATDPIHRQIEQAFHTKNLYYDRRKGYYRDQNKPVAQIVSVIEVVQAMASVVLQRPDQARARPRDYIKKDSLYDQIFASSYKLTLYIVATQLCRRVGDYLDTLGIEAVHRRNINFYLAMYLCCELISNAHADPGRIQQIDVSASITPDLLGRCYKRVRAAYETIAEQEKGQDGDKDYDVVARGPKLLAALQRELKRRLSPKKEK